MDFASASLSQVEPSPSPYRNHQHVAISHISMSPYCHITRYCHHHIAILSFDNHNIAIRLPYIHITITILYDAKSMTMHDDDDNDDDDKDYYYIEDGNNNDDVMEMLYAEQCCIPMCTMNCSTVRYCDQINRNRTHTVLPPSDHPDHHQYGAHSGLSRLAWWKGSRGDVGLRVRQVHMTSRMVADGHFQFDLML